MKPKRYRILEVTETCINFQGEEEIRHYWEVEKYWGFGGWHYPPLCLMHKYESFEKAESDVVVQLKAERSVSTTKVKKKVVKVYRAL